jgi:hypothetical protein
MATKITTPAAVAATIDAHMLTLAFQHGKELIVDMRSLSPTIAQAAIMHGLKQKLVDAAAIARNPDTGASATIDDKFQAVLEVYERITSPTGTWNKVRGDGTGTGGTGLLVRALMAIFGKDEDSIRVQLDDCSDEEVKALRSSPKVAAKMAELKAAKSNIDTDALLSKFGAK